MGIDFCERKKICEIKSLEPLELVHSKLPKDLSVVDEDFSGPKNQEFLGPFGTQFVELSAPDKLVFSWNCPSRGGRAPKSRSDFFHFLISQPPWSRVEGKSKVNLPQMPPL